jgi:arabinose-5-phosphate isomerase
MTSAVLDVAKRVLALESAAIAALADRIGPAFEDSVDRICKLRGRLVLSGVGKSGHIARKIAATFASTGTPAFFVHAAEAGHGDLGMITPDDLLVVISNSGESDEVVNLALFVKRFGTPVVAMTGSAESSLGKLADLHLDCSVEQEACPLGIAPTASTSAQLALGDALAMATLTAKGFTQEDFAKTHPNGALGRKLFLRVSDVMKKLSEVPHLTPDTKILAAVSEMAASRIGAVLALNGAELAGIFTDSDLRRLLAKNSDQLGNLSMLSLSDVISVNPMTIQASALASEAISIFEDKHVSRLVCLDDMGQPCGLLSFFDLLDFKVA